MELGLIPTNGARNKTQNINNIPRSFQVLFHKRVVGLNKNNVDGTLILTAVLKSGYETHVIYRML